MLSFSYEEIIISLNTGRFLCDPYKYIFHDTNRTDPFEGYLLPGTSLDKRWTNQFIHVIQIDYQIFLYQCV